MTTLFIEKQLGNNAIDNHLLKLKMVYHVKKIELCKAGVEQKKFAGGSRFFHCKITIRSR